jgi:S-formylglutathione hydrolase FrmB
MKPRLILRVWQICLLSFLLGVLLTASAQVAAADSEGGPLRFKVRVGAGINAPISGRLLVFFGPLQPASEEMTPGFGADTQKIWIAAREITNAGPDTLIEFSPDELVFPAPFSTRPRGDYQVMALLDLNHDYAYAGDSPGDIRSPVISLPEMDPAHAGTMELVLNTRIPEPKFDLPPSSEIVDFVSPSLSLFWGRPIHMRGVVVLPPSYGKSDDAKSTYPTVYWTHGFGHSLPEIASSIAARIQKKLADGKYPEMIWVLLDQSCAGGTHEFADSVNNGPWGQAFVTEFVPYIESHYRTDGKRDSRFLTGHSSGGWATLWLEVNYPEVFGGSWPTAPDPPDFRNFTGPNLHATPPQNFYRRPNGTHWPLVREHGKETMSLKESSQQERVLGDFGGQMASFEWVFSPRGKDGRPMPLFDRDTGVVDPEVAKAWEAYDIAAILRKNADHLRPLLDGRIHLTVGTADTFHLDESVRLLEETAKELNLNIQFTFLQGKDHSNLYDDGLDEQIAREMQAIARPKAKVAAAP